MIYNVNSYFIDTLDTGYQQTYNDIALDNSRKNTIILKTPNQTQGLGVFYLLIINKQIYE